MVGIRFSLGRIAERCVPGSGKYGRTECERQASPSGGPATLFDGRTHPLIVVRWGYIERGLRDILALMLNIKDECFPSFMPSTALGDVLTFCGR
jgi:hypothetical protein